MCLECHLFLYAIAAESDLFTQCSGPCAASEDLEGVGEGRGVYFDQLRNPLRQAEEKLTKKNLDPISTASYAIKVFQSCNSV